MTNIDLFTDPTNLVISIILTFSPLIVLFLPYLYTRRKTDNFFATIFNRAYIGFIVFYVAYFVFPSILNSFVPDPNQFSGAVRIKRAGAGWEDVPLRHSYAGNSRGLGMADMADAVLSGRAHRASAEMAYHVLDLMWAFHDSAEAGQHMTIESSCALPEPMPLDPIFGEEQ